MVSRGAEEQRVEGQSEWTRQVGEDGQCEGHSRGQVEVADICKKDEGWLKVITEHLVVDGTLAGLQK